MRFTGSFHTMVDPRPGDAGDLVRPPAARSRRAWVPFAHGHRESTSRPRLWPMTTAIDGAADRPLRADDAAGGAAGGHRAPPLGVRAVPAPAARGAPVRRRGRCRPGSRRLEAFRFDDEVARGPARPPVVDEPTLEWLASLPVPRRHLGLPRGRDLLPLLPADGRGAHVRRGGAARDAAAVDPQPRLGDRLGRLPDDLGRRRPAVHRDGVAAYPRGGGGRGRAGGVRRGLRRPPPTSPRGSGTACRPPAPARTASRSCTTPSARRSPPRSSRWARAPRCSSTPTTSPRRSRLGVEVAGPELGAVRIDSGDLGVLAHAGPRSSWTRSVPTGTRIIVTSDLDEHAIAALAAAPVDGYGVGTSLVTGSGHPTCGFVYKLVAARGRPTARWSRWRRGARTRSPRWPEVRPAPPRRPTGSPRPRWSASARRRHDDGDDRSLLVPLVRDGEVVGPRGPRRRPGSATSRRARSCRCPRAMLSRGEPVIPTLHVGA